MTENKKQIFLNKTENEQPNYFIFVAELLFI